MASSAAELIRGTERPKSNQLLDQTSNLTKETFLGDSKGQIPRFTVGHDNNPARIKRNEPNFLEIKPMATKNEDISHESPSFKSLKSERKLDFELKEPSKIVDIEPIKSIAKDSPIPLNSDTSFTKSALHAFLTDNFNNINSGNDRTVDDLELHEFSKSSLTPKQNAMLKFAQTNYQAIRNLSTSENQELFSNGYSVNDLEVLGGSYMPGHSARRIWEGTVRMSNSREVGDYYRYAFGWQAGVMLTNPTLKFGPKVGLAIAGSIAIVGVGSFLAYNRQKLNLQSLFYTDSENVKN